MASGIEVLRENRVHVLKPVMRASFGFVGNFMVFDRGKHTLIYKEDDAVLGGVVLSEIPYQKRKRIGIVKYIFTASSNLFVDQGFRWLRVREQWRRYRWSLPKVWLLGNHFFDIGLFWWSKMLKEEDPVKTKRSSLTSQRVLIEALTVSAAVA